MDILLFLGSHWALAEHFRHGGYERLVTEGKPSLRKLEVASMFPQGVGRCLGRAGDVFLAHQCTAHFIGPNASPNIRYAVYFRVQGPQFVGERKRHFKEAMLFPFQHWPGMQGLISDTDDSGK